MIVTLTPNPSLDRTLHVPELRRNEVNRASASLTEPSGKGVNVSLALHRSRHSTTAVLPVGGGAGVELVALLDAAGLRHDDVAIEHGIRSNISLVEADGTTTKINESGAALGGSAVTRLLQRALANTDEGDWLAICGSWPDGFDADDVRTLLARARAKGVSTALDTAGSGLHDVLAGTGLTPAGAPEPVPHVVKPNAAELAELCGSRLRTVGEVLLAAGTVLDRGVSTVLVSLGGDGALLLERDRPALWGRVGVPRVVNTAGAGDAFLAGYLLAADLHASAADRLACALRFGGSAVQAEGTLFDEVDVGLVVTIEAPDPDRVLTEPAGP